MIYEWRSYQATLDTIDRLHARFRDHTLRLFERHGIEIIGFWTESDSRTRLHYLARYADIDAREAAWESFRSDPEWHEVKRLSESDGSLVVTIDKVFLEPTDYSPFPTG